MIEKVKKKGDLSLSNMGKKWLILLLLLFLIIPLVSATQKIEWLQMNPSANYSASEVNAEMISFDGKLWIMGGSVNNDISSSVNGSTWEYEGEADWTGRYSFCLMVYNDSIWVIGGISDLDDVWYSFNGINWTESQASAPFNNRRGHACAVLNGEMYMLGGYEGTPASDEQSDVWKSSDGVTWTEVNTGSPHWGARDEHIVLTINDTMYIAGGQLANNSYTNDVWATTDGGNWTLQGYAPWSGRKGFGFTELNDLLIIFGGDNTGSARLSDVWYSTSRGVSWVEYENETLKWSARKFFAFAKHDTLDNKTYLTGGDVGGQNDVWQTNYTPPNVIPQLVDYNYATPSPMCYDDVAVGLGGYQYQAYAFHLLDGEGDTIYADMLFQYPFYELNFSLENVSIYSACFEDTDTSTITECSNATGGGINWRSTQNESVFGDFNVTDYNDVLFWTDEENLGGYTLQTFPYSMRDFNCWYYDVNGTLSYYTTAYENNLPTLVSYNYDTGSPICINENRTYFNFVGFDDEDDTMYVRVFCKRKSNFDWYLLTPDLEISCAYSNETGFFTDRIFITDAVNLPLGNARHYDFLYEVAVADCFEQGEDGGKVEDKDDFYASESGFHESGLNETWIMYRGMAIPEVPRDGYQAKAYDWEGKCPDWKIMKPLCPWWFLLLYVLKSIWNWIFSNFGYFLLLLLVTVIIVMIKSSKGKEKITEIKNYFRGG